MDRKGKARKQRHWSEKQKRHFASRLNANPALSERWFFSEWVQVGMAEDSDLANEPFCGFIPDVINHRYGYVIEVDGSIHQRSDVKIRDGWKDKVFKKKGYEVFRIEAFNSEQFVILCDEIEAIRAKHARVSKPKTILQRASNGVARWEK